MNQTELIYLAIALSGISILLSVLNFWLGKKRSDFRKIFSKDVQPDNLEELLESITDTVAQLQNQQAITETELEKINKIGETTFRYSSVVRFNSGGSDGGNLSFALALLNSQQSGLIITSLHGREHNRIYCKGVVEGQSQQQLSEEERKAFIDALTTVENPAIKNK